MFTLDQLILLWECPEGAVKGEQRRNVLQVVSCIDTTEIHDSPVIEINLKSLSSAQVVLQ